MLTKCRGLGPQGPQGGSVYFYDLVCPLDPSSSRSRGAVSKNPSGSRTSPRTTGVFGLSLPSVLLLWAVQVLTSLPVVAFRSFRGGRPVHLQCGASWDAGRGTLTLTDDLRRSLSARDPY